MLQLVHGGSVHICEGMWDLDVHFYPKGNQPWIFTGRTDAEAEAPILWPPDTKSRLIGKDPDTQKDWRQKKKRATEDEIAWKPHWVNGHESEQTPGENGGQRSMMGYSPWVHRELDTTSTTTTKSLFLDEQTEIHCVWPFILIPSYYLAAWVFLSVGLTSVSCSAWD